MPVLGFNHYNLRAPRALLDDLRDFYSDVVGLTLGPRPDFASFGYWLYADERPILHLSEARPDEARAIATINTFDHAAFTCSGRTEFEKKLALRAIHYEVARVPLTKQVQLFFRDPAGNGVELNFADEWY
jgi:catechol-2,3-dioxygenase